MYLNLEWSLHCSADFLVAMWYPNFIAKAAWFAIESTETFGSLHHNHRRSWGILVAWLFPYLTISIVLPL